MGRVGGWRKILKRVGLPAAGVVVLAMVAFGAIFSSGGNDIEAFCQSAKPGLPVTELAALAERHGVRLRKMSGADSGPPSLLAHTARSYGRHTCVIVHDNQIVVESRNSFAD